MKVYYWHANDNKGIYLQAAETKVDLGRINAMTRTELQKAGCQELTAKDGAAAIGGPDTVREAVRIALDSPGQRFYRTKSGTRDWQLDTTHITPNLIWSTKRDTLPTSLRSKLNTSRHIRSAVGPDGTLYVVADRQEPGSVPIRRGAVSALFVNGRLINSILYQPSSLEMLAEWFADQSAEREQNRERIAKIIELSDGDVDRYELLAEAARRHRPEAAVMPNGMKVGQRVWIDGDRTRKLRIWRIDPYDWTKATVTPIALVPTRMLTPTMRRTEAETAEIVDHRRALPQYAGRTLVSPNGLLERDPVQWGDAYVGEIFRLTKPDGVDAAIALTSEAGANLAEEVSFERLTQPPKAALPLFRSDTQAALLAALFADPAAELTLSELAERTGSALSGVHREIARLSSATLIVERRQGANRLVRPNLEHPASGPIQEILRLDLQS